MRKFTVFKIREVEFLWPISKTNQGQPRSKIMVPIDNAWMVCYSIFISAIIVYVTFSKELISQCSKVVRNCYKGDVASEWEIAIFGHLGLWNPWTDRVESLHDWLRPRRDNPRPFWWQSVERGQRGKYPICTTICCPFLLVTFFDSIKQATADTAEPILTRDSSYDVSS